MQRSIFILFFFLGTLLIQAQDGDVTSETVETNDNQRKSVIRPANAITAAVGMAGANADLPDAKFDVNMQIGYKRSLGRIFNIVLTYNKFNIVFEDKYYEGFMSFDLDLEFMLLPEKEFTPYIYAGPGFHAANYFTTSEMKFQLGLGLEYLVSDNLGLKLYADRNFLSEDILDGLEAGGGNDAYYKIGFGVNYYFPLNGRKRKIDGPSFRKKNQLDDF